MRAETRPASRELDDCKSLVFEGIARPLGKRYFGRMSVVWSKSLQRDPILGRGSGRNIVLVQDVRKLRPVGRNGTQADITLAREDHQANRVALGCGNPQR